MQTLDTFSKCSFRTSDKLISNQVVATKPINLVYNAIPSVLTAVLALDPLLCFRQMKALQSLQQIPNTNLRTLGSPKGIHHHVATG